MQFEYFRPHSDIRNYVGSYYDMSTPDGLTDLMRAEIANVRFVLKGYVDSNIGGTDRRIHAGQAVLTGPTHIWSNVKFSEGAQVFGAAITPLGWAKMFGICASKHADMNLPLLDYIPEELRPSANNIFNAPDGKSRADAADALFTALTHVENSVNEDFLDQVTAWITDPEPNELEDLMDKIGMSARQAERLCKTYFGTTPKKLHRKFRALHSANRLTWQHLTDWRDVATTAYFDQSHFIREFKQFNGRTPGEFIKGAHILVRVTLEERLQIVHGSPYSLVG